MVYHKQDDAFYSDAEPVARKWPTDTADHWVEQEVGNLREDVEEAKCAQIEAEDTCDKALDSAERYRRKHDALMHTVNEKVDKMNGKLREKSMIYLDLICEYEIILDQYASSSMVKLTTSKITNLRKRGGLE